MGYKPIFTSDPISVLSVRAGAIALLYLDYPFGIPREAIEFSLDQLDFYEFSPLN
jgi:hypothetical protein